MSVEITQYVVPELPWFRFAPDGGQVDAILQLLAASGWIDPGHNVAVADLQTQRAPETVPFGESAGCLAETLVLQGASIATFSSVPSTQGTPFGGPDLVVRQADCYGLSVLAVHRLCMIPPDMSGTPILCPSCGEDIVRGFDNEEPSLALSPYFPAPDRCWACRETLEHSQLVGRIEVGRRIVEQRVPFYRFGVQLCTTGHPVLPEGHAGQLATDAGLLDGLHRACEKPWRSFTRWG